MMNEKDLLQAIGEVSEKLIEKTALPDTSAIDTEPSGEERFIMKTTNAMNQEDKKQKNSFFTHPAVAAAVAVVVLAGNVMLFTGIAKMRGSTDSTDMKPAASVNSETDQPRMPNLIGLDINEAMLMYGDKLNIVVDSREYSNMEQDRIFVQDIPIDDPVAAGDTVHVRVSIGPQLASLPDVRNMDFESAKDIILKLGMFVDKRTVYSDEVPAGYIVDQDPHACDIKPGTYVRLMVSLGPNDGTGEGNRDSNTSKFEGLGQVTLPVQLPDSAEGKYFVELHPDVIALNDLVADSRAFYDAGWNQNELMHNFDNNGFCATSAFKSWAGGTGTTVEMTVHGSGFVCYDVYLRNTETGDVQTLGYWAVDLDAGTIEQIDAPIAGRVENKQVDLQFKMPDSMPTAASSANTYRVLLHKEGTENWAQCTLTADNTADGWFRWTVDSMSLGGGTNEYQAILVKNGVDQEKCESSAEFGTVTINFDDGSYTAPEEFAAFLTVLENS